MIQVNEWNSYRQNNPVMFQQLVDIINAHHYSYSGHLSGKKQEDLLAWINEIVPSQLKDDEDFKYSTSTKCFWILNDLHDFPKCKQCGKNEGYVHKNVKSLFIGYSDFCSLKCTQRSQATISKKKATCKKNYGVEFPAQNADVQELRKKTNLEVYGTICPTVLPEIKARRKRTRLKNNFKKHILARSGTCIPLFTAEEYASCGPRSTFKWKCKECNREFKAKLNWNFYKNTKISIARCLNCYLLMHGSSNGEEQLAKYIRDTLRVEVVWKDSLDENRLVIPPYEIDIWIPSLNIGIEYDGSFWHSEECRRLHDDDKSTVNKQLFKTMLAEDKDIILVHVYEDEWLFKRDAMKQYLKKLLLDGFKFKDDQLTLPRDKFPKSLHVEGYHLVEELAPSIETRTNGVSSVQYHIWNCGFLVYKKGLKEGDD